MKKTLLIMMLATLGLLIPAGRADAQIIDAIEDAIKAALMAVDLGIQKVQTETVNLQNAQKAVENAMQQTQLGDITSWVQQQKDLFSKYYQELLQVKNALATYDKVVSMIDKQAQLVKDYQTAYAAMQKDSHFSAKEISYIGSVYSGILNQSVENLKQLDMVITALVTQMSDGSRLRIIDGAGSRIDQNYSDLHQFTQQNILLSMQRATNANDLQEVELLYGLQ
jgi:DNA repair ATPase RecN